MRTTEQQTPALNPHMVEQPNHIDLFDVISDVWARKFIIILPAISFALIAFVIFSLKAPDFVSEAQIIVENRENVFTQPVQSERRVTEQQILLDQEAVRSQVEVLKSRDLAVVVAKELGLFESPEFTQASSPVLLVMRILDTVGIAPGMSGITEEERVLNNFAKKLKVFPVTRTRVIAVQFRSSNPDLAAKVVDALVDAYLVRLREAKQSSTRDATRWLSEQIDDLRAEVEGAEANVAKFRSDKGILLGLNDAPLQAQQLTELNSQLIAARAQKSEAQARAQMIKATLRSGQDLAGSSDVLQSQLISRLQEQLITLEANEAELSSTFLPGHPRLRETRAEISRLKEQIRSEMQKIVRALESEAQVAAARENAISASLEGLKEQVATTGTDEVQLRALEREAKAKRDLLETLLGRFREATARENPDSATADARVISRPRVSNLPITPNPLLVAAAAFVLVSMIMAGLVFSLSLARAGRAAAQHQRALVSGELELEEQMRGIPAPETITPPSDPMARLNQILSAPLNKRRAAEEPDAGTVGEQSASGETDIHPDVAQSAVTPVRETQRVQSTDVLQVSTVQNTPTVDPTAGTQLHRSSASPQVTRAPEAPLTPFGAPLSKEATPTLIVDADNGHDLETETRKLLKSGATRILVTTPREPEISNLIATVLAKSIGDGNARAILVNSCFEEDDKVDGPGLADVMQDRVSLETAIHADSKTGIDRLRPGKMDISPILLSGSDRFLTLFERLEKDYDVIVVAAPPINTHPEGRLMAPFMDAAILVIMAEGDSRAAERAEHRLLDTDLTTIIRYTPGASPSKTSNDNGKSLTPFETAAQ